MLFSEERILTRILLQTAGAEMPKPLAPEDKFARVVATRLPVADRKSVTSCLEYGDRS